MKDLFEKIDTLPESARAIVEEYNIKLYDNCTYEICEEFLDKMYALGYTFYFSKDTLKFFGQTISKFKVKRMEDGRVRISQMTKYGTESVRFFNPVTNDLDHL